MQLKVCIYSTTDVVDSRDIVISDFGAGGKVVISPLPPAGSEVVGLLAVTTDSEKRKQALALASALVSAVNNAINS